MKGGMIRVERKVKNLPESENRSKTYLRRGVIMKKILLISLTIILCATWSFAADFAPSKMVLTVPDDPIIYPFDGTDVDITFDLSGSAAAIWLVINTKLDDAEKPVDLTNGHMGWHYVNKIDTTVYVSSKNQKDAGTGLTITWDGHSDVKDGGGQVTPGQYTYYLWGFDDQTPRQRVSDYASVGFEWGAMHTIVHELGEDGLPATKPMLMGARQYAYCTGDVWRLRGSHYKWEIGSDPQDLSKLIYTNCSEYIGQSNADLNWGTPVFQNDDFDTFYHVQFVGSAKLSTPLKWTFVPEGSAIKDTDWGNWDNITWDSLGSPNGSLVANMFSDGDYLYVADPGQNPVVDVPQWDMLRCMEYDGTEIYNKQLASLFYIPDDNGIKGWFNSEFDRMYPSRDGGNKWLLSQYQFCQFYYADLTRLLDDETDETDLVDWANKNGDYFIDNNWNEGSEQPWACAFGGYKNENDTRHELQSLDKYNFMFCTLSYHGLDSFCVSTNDGTGIAYMQFADDSIATNTVEKMGGYVVHGGSAYDGIYYSSALGEGQTEHTIDVANWVAFDNVKGIIADESPDAVEDEEVAKFSVDQNSPNPFNPTTTIGFNLVEDGNVSIDIFNVAGQKIDTLVNDFMTAGKHSVVWDADGFSAGVYFYTIKSGDFSKTMKMTLLK